MRYQRVRWSHSFADEPVLLYSEISDDGFENRKVEEYADGRRDRAGNGQQFASTYLSAEPLPPLDAINAQDEFVGEEITAVEFETVWAAAAEELPRQRADVTSEYVTEEELSVLERLTAHGSPVPWQAMVEGRDHTSGDSFIRVGDEERHLEDIYVHRDGGPAAAADLDLIASSRTYLPVLLAEIRRLRQNDASPSASEDLPA